MSPKIKNGIRAAVTVLGEQAGTSKKIPEVAFLAGLESLRQALQRSIQALIDEREQAVKFCQAVVTFSVYREQDRAEESSQLMAELNAKIMAQISGVKSYE